MIGLIDTHQHLVYPDAAGYSWTEGIPVLADKAFTLADYQALTEGLGIEATLFMETAVDDPDMATETKLVSDLAKSGDSGIVGLIATCRPETDEGFDAWIEDAKGQGAVGFRRILHVVEDDMSQSETFRANVRKIGAKGMTFDMCFLARQLPLAAELADACPDTSLILDHCGVPDIAGGGLNPWREDIRRLSERPNVTCKLSGILAYCAPDNATLEAIRPYVDHVLETFEPERMVWGSDWPVVDMANGIHDWLHVTRQILEALSDAEAKFIAQETARRVYGLK
ncbi:MAG: amidohydrolase [Paracoccaceae bacterium]|nr:amidohydrolase [Paracoccaceae bacterium]